MCNISPGAWYTYCYKAVTVNHLPRNNYAQQHRYTLHHSNLCAKFEITSNLFFLEGHRRVSWYSCISTNEVCKEDIDE